MEIVEVITEEVPERNVTILSKLFACGIRTGRYKLIFFYGADFTDVHGGEKVTGKEGNRYFRKTPVAWEFYELDKDPHEMVYKYANPEYKKAIGELKLQLKHLRDELDESDENYPHIQEIIERHWDD